VTRRLLCSSDKDLYLKNTKFADKKLQYEIEAEEVMSNLSEEGRQKKKRLEVQLEIMRQRNEKVNIFFIKVLSCVEVHAYCLN
jgi:hypothetical protein